MRKKLNRKIPAQTSATPTRRVIPHFEMLEDRTLPSTFKVLNTADSGSGSLRAAILAAENNPGADVITFAKSVQGTITLTTGELLISTDLTIKGPGSSKLAVSGNDTSRIFHVVGGADETSAITVGISDLKVTHGRADEGAGINHEGFADLTLAKMRVSDNLVLGNAFSGGGGIRSFGSGARLNVHHSVIADNRVEGLAGAFVVFGGGIYVQGTPAFISFSTITGNQVVGSPEAGTAVGGGIMNRGGATMTVTQSTISNNRTMGGAGGGEGAGGGIGNTFDSTLHVTYSKLIGNEARATDGGDRGQAIGGAIDNGFGSSIYISDSLLTGNRAIAGSGAFNDADDSSPSTAFGGAIAADIYLEVTRCTLADNQAIGGNNATNAAPTTADVGAAHGGAIVLGFGGEAIIRDSAILNNKAIGGNGNTGSGPVSLVGTATGGGIDNEIDLVIFGEPSDPPRLTVINSTLAGNEARGGTGNTGSGGHVFLNAGLGGGIANFLGGISDISGSSLIGNKAIGGNGGLGAGGGIFNGISTFPGPAGEILVPSIVNVSHSLLSLNLAQGGPGDPGGDGLGGGAYNGDGSSLTLKKCIVTLNKAMGGESDGQGIGGGVYNLGTLDFDASTVIGNNHASTSHDDIFTG